MHLLKVKAVVYRQGLCCTFGWTRKSPWQHTREGHDGADGYPFTLPTCACQTDDATGVTRCPSWIKAQSQVFPSLLAPQSLSAVLNQFSTFLLSIVPHFAFNSILSFLSLFAYLKPKISWLHSQAR